MLSICLLVCSLFFVKDPALKHASTGIYALNTKTGEVLIDDNSEKSLMPASTLKVVTTGAALSILGKDFKFETQLQYDGKIKEGALYGNLYIKGGGDPTLGSDRIEGSASWEKQLEIWNEAIKSLGITKIYGKVIADTSLWEEAMASPSWNIEDVGNYYGAGSSALSFHENMYFLSFVPGMTEGEGVKLEKIEPLLPELKLISQVLTGPEGSGDRACIFGREYSWNQVVRGTIPKGKTFTIKGAIPNPAAFVAESMTSKLQDSKIQILKKECPQGERKTFHTTFSPSLEKIIFFTNQNSINLCAENLLKKIAEVKYHKGSYEAGCEAIIECLSALNIDVDGCHLEDGSGLSRKNLITAKQLVHFLQEMKKTPYFKVFYNSLIDRQNNVRVKTGTLSGCRCCVGYANDVAFAIMINNCQDEKSAKRFIDLFLDSLSRIDQKNTTP